MKAELGNKAPTQCPPRGIAVTLNKNQRTSLWCVPLAPTRAESREMRLDWKPGWRLVNERRGRGCGSYAVCLVRMLETCISGAGTRPRVGREALALRHLRPGVARTLVDEEGDRTGGAREEAWRIDTGIVPTLPSPLSMQRLWMGRTPKKYRN
eukprot:Hpha_TRINITY_DN16087_c0_g2::TRINITY_DN16087_c0_g2_i1::g.118555::m.118555